MLRMTTIQKILVMFALVILLASAFSRVNMFSNTAYAPYINDKGEESAAAESEYSLKRRGGIPTDEVTPDALEYRVAAVTSESPDQIEVPGKLPAISASNDYIAISMDTSDIYRGSLILVNYENRFEIPKENDFVAVTDVMTLSYKVADNGMMLSASIMESLNEMMDAFFTETGRDAITIRSAFRDYNLQQRIYDDYVALVGRTEAPKWASLPGHSEHHTGLAFDFGVYVDGEVSAFTNTGVNTWFVQNSWQYGFIPRYPNDKTEITKTAYEPWHFRYVGEPHAYIILQNNWCFEEYMEFLMEYTPDDPYINEYNGIAYEIYYTRDTGIKIPPDCDFDISGNNIDGFIVTVRHP